MNEAIYDNEGNQKTKRYRMEDKTFPMNKQIEEKIADVKNDL